MKDTLDSMQMARPAEQEGYSNRRLIRPSLSRPEHNHNHSNHLNAGQAPMERRDRPERPSGGKKLPPPETTNAENFYYQKQMQAKTPMVIVLHDGDSLQGVIEWYDRSCIKINRAAQPNVLIYKAAIKYMFKASER